MDDPRVRADPSDSITAGTHWFDLLNKLRILPMADRPTLYTIQADLIAAVYAVGLGRLSKAAALLSSAITTSIDTGLHRSSDGFEIFDPIEDEVRKRTFWCVYIWDKQLSAHFGRPPMIRWRDCDVGEPSPVDDEYITRDGIREVPPNTPSRLEAFNCSVRILLVLESVLDIPPARDPEATSPFLRRAASLLSSSGGKGMGFVDLREEETLLDEIHHSVPAHWQHTQETMTSDDPIRITQASRLHCAEHFVRLLIYRQRFSQLFAQRAGPGAAVGMNVANGVSLNGMSMGGEQPQTEAEREALRSMHNSALEIIMAHLNVARKGLMTYCKSLLPLSLN
jgi:hypothetical protein